MEAMVVMTDGRVVDALVELLEYDKPGDTGFWSKNPPAWSKDPFNDDCAAQCGLCGAWEHIVRPGKSQCQACAYNNELAMCWQAATLIRALEAERDDLKQRYQRLALDEIQRLGQEYDNGPNLSDGAPEQTLGHDIPTGWKP
jgi:hypothetical protein